MENGDPNAKRARTESDGKLGSGLRDALDAQGRGFDFTLTGEISDFDQLWRQSWRELGEGSRCNRLNDASARSSSTADSDNRKKDKADLEKRLALQEAGDAHTVLYDANNQVLAVGYVQVLYGDHGDYFELLEKHVNWSLFTQHKLKGPGRHYHEHRTDDGSVQLYDQFNTVADEPNPPPGPKSKNNNRTEGYAAYRPGVLYMPTEAVKRIDRVVMDGRSFDFSFPGSKSLFDQLWRRTWGELNEESSCNRLTDVSARTSTTADSDNRLRDKAALETRLGLPEQGQKWTVLRDERDQVLAVGYVQVLYGDHGDYFELMEKNVNWSLFTQHKLKGPGRHYHEHRTDDDAVQLYDQFKTVADEPNPPPGPKSKSNNRAEGYAPYRPGVIYLSTDAVFKVAELTKAGRSFDFNFTGSKSFFDALWRSSWEEFGEESRCSRLAHASSRPDSTADSDNRLRDKADLKARLGLEEHGDSKTVLYGEKGNILAVGFVQILFGDHGDYFELLEGNVNWSLFTKHKLKGPGRHYHEHHTSDGLVQLYDQFNTVADEPNPPPGPKSKNNNRAEGYAAYRPGVLYMATEAVKTISRL